MTPRLGIPRAAFVAPVGICFSNVLIRGHIIAFSRRGAKIVAREVPKSTVRAIDEDFDVRAVNDGGREDTG